MKYKKCEVNWDDENILDMDEKKIYTNKSISLATFLGGPIAAGFLIAKNFKVFGNDRAARKSISIGINSTFILFIGLFFLPEHIVDRIPQPIIPAAYTSIIYFIVEKLQGQKIKDFIEEGGKKASGWSAAGYGFLGLLIIAMLTFILTFSTLSNELEKVNGYEKNISVSKNVTLYYSDSIKLSESKKIADKIKQSEFLRGNNGADIFLNYESDFYRLKFIIPDTTLFSDTLFLSEFNLFENYLNKSLSLDRRIEIGFTDANLLLNIELKEVSFDNTLKYKPLPELTSYPISNFHTIYYNSSMPIHDLKKFGDGVNKLKGYFPPEQFINIIFLNTETEYTLKLFTPKKYWRNKYIIRDLNNTVNYIRKLGLGKEIKLIVIDNDTFEEKEIQIQYD